MPQVPGRIIRVVSAVQGKIEKESAPVPMEVIKNDSTIHSGREDSTQPNHIRWIMVKRAPGGSRHSGEMKIAEGCGEESCVAGGPEAVNCDDAKTGKVSDTVYLSLMTGR